MRQNQNPTGRLAKRAVGDRCHPGAMIATKGMESTTAALVGFLLPLYLNLVLCGANSPQASAYAWASTDSLKTTAAAFCAATAGGGIEFGGAGKVLRPRRWRQHEGNLWRLEQTVDAAAPATRHQHPLTVMGATVEDTADATADTPSSFSVKSSAVDEEADLSPEERTVVDVYRRCGPSVAFVTSVVRRGPSRDHGDGDRGGSRRKGRRGGRGRGSDSRKDGDANAPEGGVSLGSGSGFLVESDGYLLTNYHVVQRAYQMNQSSKQIAERANFLANNATIFNLLFPLAENWLKEVERRANETTPAEVLVRINSSTKYRKVRIVDVVPELDMAVLKLLPEDSTALKNSTEDKGEEAFPAIEAGSSSNLLVGQKVVAIGNPFGFDSTVTSGVVSALNREVRGVAGNTIRRCVQTDAAINPGNSGGPLLDARGKWVGVNTAIVTTSGSNAGIGFAVPADEVKRAAEKIIIKDRMDNSPKVGTVKGSGYFGIELASAKLQRALLNRSGDDETATRGVLITNVKSDSPARAAFLKPLSVDSATGTLSGDKILAINGRAVNTVEELEDDFRQRVEGEKVDVTVESFGGGEAASSGGTRRVVYITLGRKP